MQVVEAFVKEETIVTILQSYVEANFLNDMMNFQHEIMGSVIENELRRCIKGVLSDIYFAHISTLFLENHITVELKSIARDQYNTHQQ